MPSGPERTVSRHPVLIAVLLFAIAINLAPYVAGALFQPANAGIAAHSNLRGD
jgi:hypothetical protein